MVSPPLPRPPFERKPRISRQTLVEQAIVELARRQQRCLGIGQLLRIGLGRKAIEHRARLGRLHREHRGVYILGPPAATDLERAWAASLACGSEAALFDDSALAMWDLGPFPFLPRIAVPGNRRHPGIIVHRLTGPLHPADIRRRHGLRVAAPARALLDAAVRRTEVQLIRVVDDALRAPRLRLTRAQLADVIARYPRHAGADALRPHGEVDRNPTRSDFEVEFLAFCASHGLPTPLVNTGISGHEVDAFFPAERVIVECDGWSFHNTRNAFESDRDRDADHLALGLPTVRVTKRRLHAAPVREADRLHRILALRRSAAA